jgi:hypothetical protein
MKPAQLDLGELSTSEIIAQAWQRQKKRAGSSKRADAESYFAEECRRYRLPTYTRKVILPATHLTPKLKRAATWEFDGIFHEYKLLIEIQGGVWRKGGGAHSHPTDIIRNMQKQNDATLRGFRLLQFTPDEVMNHNAVHYTQRVLTELCGWQRVQS